MPASVFESEQFAQTHYLKWGEMTNADSLAVTWHTPVLQSHHSPACSPLANGRILFVYWVECL